MYIMVSSWLLAPRVTLDEYATVVIEFDAMWYRWDDVYFVLNFPNELTPALKFVPSTNSLPNFHCGY